MERTSKSPVSAGGAEVWPGFLLMKAGEHLKANTAAVLDQFGLTPKEFGALEVIAQVGPLTQTQLSERILVDRTTVVHLVDRLARGGWIVRGPKPGDRRSHALTLTPEGQRRLKDVRGAARAVEADFVTVLSPQELGELKAKLARLHESVSA
jgi:DNA-binding MarR family transcriptional regulator